MTPQEILDYILSIHSTELDSSNDLLERLMKANNFYLTTVNPMLIDTEFSVNDYLVSKYLNLNEKTMPPIVLLKYSDDDYTVIDGTHRITVCQLKGITNIQAYIGIVVN